MGNKIFYPVNNPVVTSKYGERISPITGLKEFHPGTDYVSGNNDRRVMAIADGVIAHDKDDYDDSKRWTPPESYGNFVIIKHTIGGKDIYIYYCHLEENTVSLNQTVEAGDVIGMYADVGMSKGAHLHIQAMIPGPQYPVVYPITNILKEV
jgi:murein DD-endopeptidase MepM/ murein hydrolase activator NlpD